MSDLELTANQGACTIVSPNYLPFARTLAESYRSQHPHHTFYVLIVADLTDSSVFENEPFTPVLLKQLPLPSIRNVAMQYDILELNTDVKPTFLKYLLAQYGLETLVYLDPDIFVYKPLNPVFALLQLSNIVLTPHLTAPIPVDGCTPTEQDMLYNGTYNLGFIAVRSHPETDKMLTWWEVRCLEQGFSEGRTGLFVDQKWINLAPGFFEGVQLCKDPGCNMAYWNLHERILTWEDGTQLVNQSFPLRFFHFSGITLDDPEALSTSTNRFNLANRPDLKNLFNAYKQTVLKNRAPARDTLPYGFDQFTDGTVVTRLARRMFAAHPEFWTEKNPFEHSGLFYSFCKRHRLISGKEKPSKSTWREFNPRDRRVEAVHRLLRFALTILGPVRYELLMRYLSFISVLRNQKVFIKNGTAE